jgi:hypothetical protein
MDAEGWFAGRCCFFWIINRARPELILYYAIHGGKLVKAGNGSLSEMYVMYTFVRELRCDTSTIEDILQLLWLYLWLYYAI